MRRRDARTPLARRPRRRLLATLSLVGLALTSQPLTGCGTFPSTLVAQVPTTGPIEQGAVIQAAEESQFIRVIARGPQVGMSPIQIVRGFLDASASFEGDHAVARQFLTPAASRQWDPGAGTQVYEGSGEVVDRGDRVAFDAGQVGAISATGGYSSASAGSRIDVEFILQQVSGEWRITDLPNGLILSTSDVDRGFRAQSVYFFNPEFSRLVPDPRMIPVLGASQATSLVRYLIDGPSAWLAPAVRTGFPQGISLNIDAVPVVDGTATVDLNALARSSSDPARQAMSQQIVWTLKQVSGIERVLITAVGQPLVVAGVPSPQPITAWPGVDPEGIEPETRSFAVVDGRVEVLGPIGTSTPVPGAGAAGTVTINEIAISPTASTLAAIDAGGAVRTAALRAGSEFVRVPSASRAMSIAYGPSDELWIVDDSGHVLAVKALRRPRSIEVDGLDAQSQVIAALPSRDGTRAALVVAADGGDQVFLARIVRSAGPDGEGESLTLQAPRRVESVLSDVIDVGWSGADTLVVLARMDDLSSGIFEIHLGRGQVTDLGALEAPVSIAATPGMPILVQSGGTIYRRLVGQWQPDVVGMSPAYPG